MAVIKRDDMPTVAEAKARLGSSLAKSAMRKAAGGSPDSKGPAGIGAFGDFTPRNFTEFQNAANPYGTASTFDGGSVRGNLGAPAQPKGSMNNALRQAMGVVPQQHPLPEMVGRVFKAFEDAEGREPTDSDSEFFKAIVACFDACDEQVADEIRKAAEGEAPEYEPVNKAADQIVSDFMKAISKESRRG